MAGPMGTSADPQQGIDFEKEEWTEHTRLGPIARRLRTLIPQAQSAGRRGDPALWDTVEDELSEMLTAIQENERNLLSNKANHALGLLKTLARDYKAKAPPGSDRAQICQFLSDVLSKTNEPWADLHGLADRWLGIVQPRYVKWKRAKPDNKPVRIKDMQEPLIAEPIDTDALRRLAEQTERQEPVGRRLAAAIIAVPN